MGRFYHFNVSPQIVAFWPFGLFASLPLGQELFISTLTLTKALCTSPAITSMNEQLSGLLAQETRESIHLLPVCLSVSHPVPASLSPFVCVHVCLLSFVCFTSPRKRNFSCRGQCVRLKVWTSALLGSPRPDLTGAHRAGRGWFGLWARM